MSGWRKQQQASFQCHHHRQPLPSWKRKFPVADDQPGNQVAKILSPTQSRSGVLVEVQTTGDGRCNIVSTVDVARLATVIAWSSPVAGVDSPFDVEQSDLRQTCVQRRNSLYHLRGIRVGTASGKNVRPRLRVQSASATLVDDVEGDPDPSRRSCDRRSRFRGFVRHSHRSRFGRKGCLMTASSTTGKRRTLWETCLADLVSLFKSRASVMKFPPKFLRGAHRSALRVALTEEDLGHAVGDDASESSLEALSASAQNASSQTCSRGSDPRGS